MASDDAKLHIPSIINGAHSTTKIFKCSCGINCGPRELYFHHLECTQSDNNYLPRDISGWPLRFFKTIPNISLMQRGCIARNSEYSNAHYIVIWLNRMQKDSNKISFSKTFIDKTLPQLKSFIVSIPLQSTKDTSKESATTMIALSNDLWRVMIDNNDNMQTPKELKQFKAKYSYIDTNECILPIYEQNYKFNTIDDMKEDNIPIYMQTQPDIFIMIKSNDSNNKIGNKCINMLDKNMISHIEQTNAFKYKGGKDLTGFIDGTKNMDYNLRDLSEIVLINDKQNTSGSYVYCSRFIHNLNKFNKFSIDDKSTIIGRKYGVETKSKSLDGRIENPRVGSDLKGHVFRSWGEMYRQSYPYKRVLNVENNMNEQGLFFCAWSHSLDEMDNSLERMMGKWGTGKQKGLDNLFKITKSIFNGYFYAPSLKELSLLCDDGYGNNELNEWINVLYNEIENKVIIPDENYIANKFIEQTCKTCENKQTVLSDDESDIYFCLECRNIGIKQ
eukprot:433725_1